MIMENKVVRYGIIGLGNQGCTYNLGLFDKGMVPQSEVTAMCDTNPQKIEYMKSKTTNSTCAESNQDYCSQQGCDIRVKNCSKSFFETSIYCNS